MRRTILLLSAVALAGCQAGGGNDTASNAVPPDNFVVAVPTFEETPEPDPTYVPATNDASGDNAMTTANQGQLYYRDLPEARVLRGDWTVKKVDWFAVSGNETSPRAAWRIAAFAGAHIRIDRQKIQVRVKGESVLGRFGTDCAGVGYLGKDALAASAGAMQEGISREDVLRDHGIAVAEKELVQAFPGSFSSKGRILSVMCPESQGDEPGATGWMTGVLPLERNRLVLLYSDGTALFATRDKAAQ